MLVCYALEARSHWFVLAFAAACVLAALYGFLQGAWPFGLVEAMTIAGFATGCEQGYLYIRGEYRLAFESMQHAIEEARRHGLLGANILGRDLSFEIEIRRGAGAYI